jgi:hypothetical protein
MTQLSQAQTYQQGRLKISPCVAGVDLTSTRDYNSSCAGSAYPSWLCGAVGFFLGGTYALAYRAATVRIWVSPKVPLNVVITGGTRGIGRALVREFLQAGDNVYIGARSARGIRETVHEFADLCVHPRQLSGAECDVSKPSSIARLVSLAQDHFADGTIDGWINNAGATFSYIAVHKELTRYVGTVRHP